jgi:hypothetical protein
VQAPPSNIRSSAAVNKLKMKSMSFMRKMRREPNILSLMGKITCKLSIVITMEE